MVVGSLFALWATTAIIFGLQSVDYQVTELFRQYLIATGMIKPLHTLVDYYTHIKGIEYLLCVVFFVAFPFFYSYLEKTRKSKRSAPIVRGK